jgi:tricorn protease
MRFQLLLALSVALPAAAQLNRGYYRFPTLHGSTVVFTAEGDLWQSGLEGGLARRLTTHAAEETAPRFSSDGRTLAFTANYEGAGEVYVMPATGGLPKRLTFGGATVAGWTADGRVLYSTRSGSTLPDTQLHAVDLSGRSTAIPLSQAAQGAYDAAGKTLFFTRLPFQGSHAKRYQGGTVQKLWKFTEGREAVPLTADYAGTSRDPMPWRGRVYFASDRDGTMNLWSMDENGRDLKQHTRHQGWDVQSPSLSEGRIIYQLGADLHIYEIASNATKKLEITLPSDFEHLRERWVKQPAEYLTHTSLSPDGSRVSLVARGRVFVAPVKQGRLVEATAQKAARYRFAAFLPDGKNLVTLSTESGEVELWKMPANGIGAAERLTTDGSVLRWSVHISPDGKWIAHTDKDNRLWLLEVATKANKQLAEGGHSSNSGPAFDDLQWSGDSRWLTYSVAAPNRFQVVKLYNVETGATTDVTTDRYNSSDAVWSRDGKYLYFLSDRSLRSSVGSPWGQRAPDPYFDRSQKIYQLALKKGLRSPFEPPDELNPDKADEPPKADAAKADVAKTDAAKTAPKVEIDLEGLAARLEEVPAPPGNYGNLQAAAKRLCWMNFDRTNFEKTTLECLDIANKGDKPETLLDGVQGFGLSQDGKKMMIRKGGDLLVVDSSVKEAALKTPKTLSDARVDLREWSFSVIPGDEFKEAFLDAWRLHRDYFYDRGMHGVDWKLMREKYGELVARVRDRAELNDLIAQMVSELSVLHTFVRGGDQRQAPDQIRLSTLGARMESDAAGAWVVKHVYQSDPDRPDRRSPLARPSVDVKEGDAIVAINGRDLTPQVQPMELLRNQAGKQVLLRVRPAGKTETRDVVVKPISTGQDQELRYHEWEYTRRLKVEQASQGAFGYLHLRAMGSGDIAQWAEHYYPVFDRQGLIIDVRHNNGGNIDSWILGKLLRRAWMYWQPRQGKPYWNMQYAFRGPIVVIVDEWTASDGEAFAEGFRRLGLGKVVGVRTWGGEIWLTSSNVLADRGIASAAEIGVYSPDRQWLIEGHGVEPDIVVDNPPNATFRGEDAQLDAAVKHLAELVKKQPNPVPEAPKYPDKSLPARR